MSAGGCGFAVTVAVAVAVSVSVVISVAVAVAAAVHVAFTFSTNVLYKCFWVPRVICSTVTPCGCVPELSEIW